MNLNHFDTILAFAAIMAGLSLVITALTQAVSGLFGLRGLNLKWGLEKLFHTLAPELDATTSSASKPDPTRKTEALARHILRHPLLSDSTFGGIQRSLSWWRYATHIRAEELANVLKAWRETLSLPQSTDAETAVRTRTIEALNIPASLSSLATDQLARIEHGLTKWFEACMDRVSQRFTANTRFITVAGAVLLSLGLVLDSLDLWKQLARQPELRSRVVASSEALLAKADELQVGSTNLPAVVYRLAADQLLRMQAGALAGFTGTEVITNRASGTNWLAAQCTLHGVTNLSRWLEEYEALVPQAALRQAADGLQGLLDEQLALGVLSSRAPFESWPTAIRAHWGGVLLSIVLLSLGAPFWFNLLRTLGNLRPTLANKETAEQEAQVKALAAGGTVTGKH
jgi:hypothetical protein